MGYKLGMSTVVFILSADFGTTVTPPDFFGLPARSNEELKVRVY
jgi:hypothetical protein